MEKLSKLRGEEMTEEQWKEYEKKQLASNTVYMEEVQKRKQENRKVL